MGLEETESKNFAAIVHRRGNVKTMTQGPVVTGKLRG